MSRRKPETAICQICGKQKKISEVVPAELVRESIVETIRKTHPDWSSSGFICTPDLNSFRAQYVRDILEKEKGELSSVEERVVKSMEDQEVLSKDINAAFERKLTFGQRLSDRFSDMVGSFIIGFFVVLIIWVAMNSIVLIFKPFDPYPFILLNLVLSCIAAIQAPIILMSQNRAEAKDRLRAEHDYLVNLKAELEIRHLNEKLDHLLVNQWQRLLEIQEVQTELMSELSGKSKQRGLP